MSRACCRSRFPRMEPRDFFWFGLVCFAQVAVWTIVIAILVAL